MKYLHHVFSVLLAALAMGLASHTAAQTQHYSALVQANQPQFATRLETPGQPDARELLSKTPASVMEYRIISDRINNRRFFKLIADAIAVNSDARLLAKNAGYISRARNALPTELQPNDQLKFAFDGKSQVTLSLNDVQLAQYEAPDFYRMLLSTWIGDVPISSRVKREILGKESTPVDIVDLFNTAQPSANRREQVQQLLAAAAAPTEAPVAVAAPAAAPKAQAKPAPKAASKPEAVASKPAATPAPVAKAAPAAKAEPAAKPAPKVAAKAAAPKPEPKAQPAPATVAKAAPVLTEEEEAARLLLRQDYLKRLNREINIHKHIPQRAFTRRAEGSVRLAITLDSAGKLQKVEIVEPSKHDMFNEQALEAVGNAQPFTPPPTGLEADPFEFETTLYYDLPL
ncbi:TonB family protein [Simiduia sp. 21SJ11W-1]|uniref:TonB family protein n=1 Tax=Simiduia sp. 21SJ11W-1 TaxID=2909669 RepID=UPI00209E8381|nr:TonB family protein [Simiduia sp. 21SJ11W-1]UTA48203.1 TonB family protein [Simiduia sp. 21SJ11W-1]